MLSSHTNSSLLRGRAPPLPPPLPPVKRIHFYKPKPPARAGVPSQRLQLGSTNRKKFHPTAAALSKTAKKVEKNANIMLEASRKYDHFHPNLYNNRNPESYRFLQSVNIINRTEVFREFAKRIPKGAHHHIHFNSALSPLFLVKEARDIQDMYIKSSLPLTDVESLVKCTIEFDIMTEAAVNSKNSEIVKKFTPNGLLQAVAWSQLQGKSGGIVIFNREYLPFSWVRYKDFQTNFQEKWRERFEVEFGTRFPSNYKEICAFQNQETQHREGKELEAKLQEGMPLNNPTLPQSKQTLPVEAWLAHKLIFTEHAGMDYNRYTRAFVIDCVHDGISVPEIRPNFMQANFLKKFDSRGRFTGDLVKNIELVGIIKHEYERTVEFLQRPGGLLRRANGAKKLFLLKIIYCTPRTFSPDEIETALQECRDMYKIYPDLIAGFDLVGQELQISEMKNENGDVVGYRRLGLLSNFQKHLLEFQVDTEQRIPFLFHCGETIAPDGLVENLKVALCTLPNVLRLGHGFSLRSYPELMDVVKSRDICIETCPTSNEILHLISTCADHPIKQFMGYGMACSVNSDNGTPFKTSLSHDFYQVLMGNEHADLFTWKELARNSLVYSCVQHQETREALLEEFDHDWEEACRAIVYGGAARNSQSHL
ncbi:hypothetical protein B7494_g2995 [Chlorociboria aeruginascens]|nr:hypothetical protein B7494_g2995 [Chlorociboria aeruginascens]